MRGKPLFVRLVFGWFKPKAHGLGADLAGEVEAVGKSRDAVPRSDPLSRDRPRPGQDRHRHPKRPRESSQHRTPRGRRPVVDPALGVSELHAHRLVLAAKDEAEAFRGAGNVGHPRRQEELDLQRRACGEDLAQRALHEIRREVAAFVGEADADGVRAAVQSC